MVGFSKGFGLTNDVFCSMPFLTPLIGSKTSTNIWKHVGIFQNTFQDTKITKIGLLAQILALLQRTQARKCCLKNRYFFIFPNFFVQWTCTTVKTNQCTKIPCWATNITIFYHLEQSLAMKMAISISENWLKNQKIQIFSTFFYIFVSNGLVHLWK